MTKSIKKNNIGIILAAGSGSRFNPNTPKQLYKLAGRLVIEYSIDTFEKCSLIHEIVVVCTAGQEKIISNLIATNSWKKIKKIVPGGSSRAASTKAALTYLGNTASHVCNVIIHDAARPLLDDSTLIRCIERLKTSEAVDVVVPAVDTIVEVNAQDEIKTIPNRSLLRAGQTPQGFRYDLILKAYEKANLEQLDGVTCDCSLLKREFPDIQIPTVLGSYSNIKITNPIDLFIAEKIIQSKTITTNNGIDNIKNKVIVIFGGSYGIGNAISLSAEKQGAIVEVASRSYNSIDINSTDDIEKFLEATNKKHGTIDCIINTAGTLIKKPLHEYSFLEINQSISTNLTAAINMAKISFNYLKHSKGCLVNFTSSSYTRGRADYATYSATKAAIVNFTQAIAEEWLKDDVRVVCICPERTRTPMRLKNFKNDDPEKLLAPEAVASACISAICSAPTGSIIDVRKN